MSQIPYLIDANDVGQKRQRLDLCRYEIDVDFTIEVRPKPVTKNLTNPLVADDFWNMLKKGKEILT